MLFPPEVNITNLSETVPGVKIIRVVTWISGSHKQGHL